MMQLLYKFIGNMLVVLCCALLHNTAVASSTIEGIQVYQKNVRLSEERKQTIAHDIDRYHKADNIWDILRAEFTLPHYEDNPYVQDQINWFMDHPDFLIHSANRAGPYLYYILQQVRKRHLPAELVLLPMIESAYNPFAYSSAGAAGIWQMMPGTASGFGIKQNWWYDGRRDVIASTKAALDYLAYLGGFFDGNWMRATAAYDTGEGNVLAAIRKNIRYGEHTDFWSLPLAQETRIYVPRLLALATIIAHPESYPIDFPAIRNAPYLAQIDVGTSIDLNHAAYLAGLSSQKLKQLNPGYNRSATGPNGPYKLVLPIENVEQFTENLVRSPLYKHAGWTSDSYKVKSGDTLFAISKKFNSTSSPSKINLAQSRYTLKPGDTLYMVRHGDNIQKIADRFHADAKALIAINQLTRSRALSAGTQLIIPTHATRTSTAKKYHLVSGDTIYMVRRGDTIEKIARKFNTTPPAIRVANLLSENTIQPGDQLVIPTHG